MLLRSARRHLRSAAGRAVGSADLRREGRHVVLLTGPGGRLPVAVRGFCSTLVAIDDGELRHAVFHETTDTIEAPWARS